MLALLSLVSLVAFCGVGGLVGWRILHLARATGEAPERWIALCLLSICGIGYPLLLISQALAPGALRIAVVSLGIVGIDVGLASIFLFTRAVFRPGARWLARALGLPFAALLVHWTGMTASTWASSGALESGDVRFSWTLLSAAISGVGFGWTAVESLRYWALLRKRVPLGLADPLVANRVLLWGLVGVSTLGINLANAAGVWRGMNVLEDPTTMIATGSLGSFNALALWLAFLPPEAWVQWVRGVRGDGAR